MKKVFILFLVAVEILTSAACSVRRRTRSNYASEEKPSQYAFEAFDTQCSISLYGINNDEISETFFGDIKTLIENYENVFSKTKEGSEIYEINHRVGDSVMICNETADLFQIAESLYLWSNNKFDISSGTLIDLWDVKNRKTLPSLAEINEARKHIGNFNYTIERDVDPESFRCNRITFHGDRLTQYDLGGLIKGYCCNAIKEMLENNDIITASIINLGGNVLCTGEVDGRAGGAFRVGIFKPFSGNEIIDTVEVKNRNVITSGNYQRYFKVDGDDRVYHHIIDPSIGYPTDNGIDSVTIISENGLLGDYLSTACMLIGFEQSKELIDFASKEFNDKNIQATFVYSDGKVEKYPKKVDTTK
ncbi:MAG: FAD:protein FMN transferase [Lachnospiraceae bacterium]|nr:FAD:protein FMN transferase [Lachnospiraceae bacterium]